ncbi:MAG: DUF2935 domain-containing protein [Clostridiales bacterium]|nr:DUF2935 domain-containing protein [Clostridiales bacterium]
MKEHSFFLEAAFTPKDQNLINRADAFRRAFDGLLTDAVSLSNGIVNQDVLDSDEVVTPYTMSAEQATIFFTGVAIPTSITQAEAGLAAGSGGAFNDPTLEQRVNKLNEDAIKLVGGLIQLKTSILTDVLACKLFTVNYPLLIDHILREAKLYLATLQRLQSRTDAVPQREALEQEVFWNRIMAEHSAFIRGLLDPTENDLIISANEFGNQFYRLTQEDVQAQERAIPLSRVTADSLSATREIRDFNNAGVQGILHCGIKSIIIPLLADHVLRECNHYLRLLNIFSRL